MLLRVTVDQHAEATTVAIAGELDLHTAPQFKDEAGSACDKGHVVTIDLSEVRFVDSTGLGALVWLRKHCLDSGGDLRLIEIPDRVERVLTMTGLDKVLLA